MLYLVRLQNYHRFRIPPCCLKSPEMIQTGWQKIGKISYIRICWFRYFIFRFVSCRWFLLLWFSFKHRRCLWRISFCARHRYDGSGKRFCRSALKIRWQYKHHAVVRKLFYLRSVSLCIRNNHVWHHHQKWSCNKLHHFRRRLQRSRCTGLGRNSCSMLT